MTEPHGLTRHSTRDSGRAAKKPDGMAHREKAMGGEGQGTEGARDRLGWHRLGWHRLGWQRDLHGEPAARDKTQE